MAVKSTIKLSSTNQKNKREMLSFCPVTFTLERIGGRWKPLILYHLSTGGMMRYSVLRKAIPGISEKMLIQQLRELETDKLVDRKVHPVVPPHVEYSLSAIGKELSPVLKAMANWGLKHQ